jgi:hypothetical protein
MRSDMMRPRSAERESHASPSRRSGSSCSIADADNRTGTRASPSGARSRRSAIVLRGVTRRPVLARDSILVNACDMFADERHHRSFTNRTHAASKTHRIINRYQVHGVRSTDHRSTWVPASHPRRAKRRCVSRVQRHDQPAARFINDTHVEGTSGNINHVWPNGDAGTLAAIPVSAPPRQTLRLARPRCDLMSVCA